MLRQALDAADKEEAAAAAAAASPASETTSLDPSQQVSRRQQHAAVSTNTSTETQTTTQPEDSYGSVTESDQMSHQLGEEEEDDDGGDDDEEEEVEEDDDDDEESGEANYLLDEWHEDEEEYEISRPPFCCRVWSGIKSAFLLVANVENLWDTPPNPRDTERFQRRRNLLVFFWFVVLASSYATERSTFKLLVDRTGPFRLFSVEMVTATHCILLGLGWFIAYLMKENSPISLGVSVVDVGLMALLDTVALMLVFLTGVHVPPTLTVILVQFTLPLTAFLTQFVHPDGRCSCMQAPPPPPAPPAPPPPPQYNGNQSSLSSSPHNYGTVDNSPTGYTSPNTNGNYAHVPVATAARIEEGQPLPRAGGLSAEHVWGSLIIFLAVLLALLPAFYSIANPEFFIYADTIPIRTAYNTLLFVSSCVPAAASQLYKEHVFLQYKQPVNVTYLNMLLSLYQFIFASIMSPLVFTMQGIGAKTTNWKRLYPSSKFSENFIDGAKCYFRLLSDDDQENKYFDDARCDFVLGLVIFHAFSIIAVGVAVDKIVNAGATKVMYRGMSAGIIVAVLCMHAYDMHIPEFSYGPAIDALNLTCLILLILGSEVYHRVGLQGSTFETTYPVVQTFYEDD